MMTTLRNPKLKRRKSISEGLAIAAIILLTLDTINILVYSLVFLLYFCSLYHLGLDLDKKQE
jgi:hypothetical protein